MKPVWAVLSIVLFIGAAAHAEEADLSGTWNFTAKLRIACEFSGQATLSAHEDTSSSDYACEMTARQYCPELGIDYTVNQSCKVRNTRGQVWVQATIKEFLKGEDTGRYYPDNFNLSLHSNSEMVGALISGGTARAAVWIRDDGTIS